MSRTLIELLQDRAARFPEKVAFEYLRSDGEIGSHLGYAELFLRAMAIGAFLQQRFHRGDRLLLVFPPGIEFVQGFFGCLYARMVAVPLAPPAARRAAEGIALAAVDAAATGILSTTAYADRARDSLGLAEAGRRIEWIGIDTVEDGWADEWNTPSIRPDDLALLQYTSGSTMAPRGVTLTHANVLANSALIRDRFGAGPDTLGVSWLPTHHDMGLIGGIIQPIYAGGGCILMAPTTFLHRPAVWLETISRRRATISGGPNFAYEQCASRIAEPDTEALDLSSWEVAFCGAEPIRAGTLAAFAARFRPAGFRREAFLPCYGLAEATLMVTSGERRSAPVVTPFDLTDQAAVAPIPSLPGSRGRWNWWVAAGRTRARPS